MKRIYLFLLFVAILFFNQRGQILAYKKQSVDKVMKFISKKWYYYNYKGRKIKIHKLSWRAYGSNYELIVNGKSIDPSIVYNKNGRNVLNPDIRRKWQIQAVTGNEKGVLKGITEAHNKYRRITGGGLPELVWDENLAKYAAKWANYLKRNNNCRMRHRSGGPYGENLAWAYSKELEADEVVKMWYNEIKDYDYASNTCRGVCGHYTQVVWKNSKRIGCGVARCGRSEVWVCNYDPPGNYVGKRPYNSLTIER